MAEIAEAVAVARLRKWVLYRVFLVMLSYKSETFNEYNKSECCNVHMSELSLIVRTSWTIGSPRWPRRFQNPLVTSTDDGAKQIHLCNSTWGTGWTYTQSPGHMEDGIKSDLVSYNRIWLGGGFLFP